MSDLFTPVLLRFIKGVQPAIGDTETAEVGYTEVINLLQPPGTDGFYMDQDEDWQPAFPQIKGGGIFKQSDAVDGRQLVAAAVDDVEETFIFFVRASNWLEHGRLMKRLFRLRDDAIAFWVNEAQIDPVFIEYQHRDAKCAQYALIKTMDIAASALDYPDNAQVAVTRVTLKILCEGWQMVVPPGGNPRVYHYWKQGKTPGVDYQMDDLRLHPRPGGATWNDTDHLHYETIQNRFEWASNACAGYLSKNWIDIDASKIPGDLPARVYFTLDDARRLSKIMVARYTGPRQFYGRNFNASFLAYNIFNTLEAVQTTVGGSGFTTPVDACGIYHQTDLANRRIIQAALTGGLGVYSAFLTWPSQNGLPAGDTIPLNVNQFHGTWAIFLRCQQTNGAQGDTLAQASISTVYANRTLDAVQVPYFAGGASCAEFRWTYLGQFSFPFTGRSYSSPKGFGLEVLGDVQDSCSIGIGFKNLNAAARTVECIDMALMPVHESFTILNASANLLPYVDTTDLVVYDNTGYSNHGDSIPIAFSSQIETSGDGLIALELRGTPITLKPGVNNRLYFLLQHNTAAQGEVSVAGDEFTIRLNIVPMCSGIADVEPAP